jgi:septal ring factor EnvC (AmiA/AmiB activator)
MESEKQLVKQIWNLEIQILEIDQKINALQDKKRVLNNEIEDIRSQIGAVKVG